MSKLPFTSAHRKVLNAVRGAGHLTNRHFGGRDAGPKPLAMDQCG
jgi:hypothetical protein